MLFYNHKHEFIGIDEDGLKLLNYTSLEDLLEVCGDVADLFAKEPGYIHNFKSFGWIDFLLHADSDARSAIVHAHGRTFTCTLSVHTLHLCAEPQSNSYIIDMTHVKTLTGDEIKPHTITQKIQPETITTSTTEESPFKQVIDPLPDYGHLTPKVLSEPGTLDIPTVESTFEPVDTTEEEFYAKLALPLNEEELQETIPETPPSPVPSERPMLGDIHYSNEEKGFLDTLHVDKSYKFDPNVAAHELGLPVDLIQEFIGDFIQQAYEFKDELFEAVLKGDISNIKILSHKLKGVAANLRIEDAFETLSIINTSNDTIEIEANLKYFFTIITKLEGKEVPQAARILPISDPAANQTSKLTEIALDEDIYDLSFKEDLLPSLQEEKNAEEPIFEKTFYEDLSETADAVEETQLAEPIIEVPVALTLHYDKHFIAGELGIEDDFFDELIGEYKTDALAAGEAITLAIGAFDTHAWKKASSHLKGISDNLRLNEISDELAILSQTNDAQEANKASKRLNNFLQQL